MQAIENLLWGGVFMAIEDREDIIFSVSCHTVLFENLQRHRDELKGQQFLRFVTGNPAARADTYARVVSGTLQPAVRKSSLPQ